MKVILLGATGQIGKVIYERLRPQYNVIATSRKKESGLFQFNPFVDDWNVLGETDILINCIGQIYESGDFSFEKIHIGITELIIKNRITLGNPRIIQVSALGASENHKVNFLRTKGIADMHLMKHPNTVIVRPSIVCTDRTMLVRKILMLYSVSRFFFGKIYLPKNFKEHKIQPVMPQDLADVVENLCRAESVPSFINVVGPEKISFRELIDRMFQLNHRTYKIIELPQWLFNLLVKLIDKMNKRIISKDQYQLLFSDNVSDEMLAKKYLGRPLTSTDIFWRTEFEIHNS